MFHLLLFFALLAFFWGVVAVGLRFAQRYELGSPGALASPAHFAAIDGLGGVSATSVMNHHASWMRIWLITGTWRTSRVLNSGRSYAVTMFFFITLVRGAFFAHEKEPALRQLARDAAVSPRWAVILSQRVSSNIAKLLLLPNSAVN